MSVDIRPTAPGDLARWRPLWDAYLAFYETDLADDVTAQTWARFHEPTSPVNAVVAERAGELIGFAHYAFQPSTWAPAGYCYLEDLFVAPSARGTGAGRALIGAVEVTAREAGCPRLFWVTQTGNEAARALYDKVATQADFVQYRIALAD